MRYRRPSRLRRVAKWLGLGVCVAIAGVVIVSMSPFAYRGNSIFFGCSDGNCVLAVPGKNSGAIGGASDLPLHARRTSPFSFRYNHSGWTGISIPLWILFNAIAFPTLVLWHLERRRPAKGHCPHCGYNLTGNESGKCPECSTPVPQQETTA